MHGIVLIGLEEKLQSIPLATVREQVTFMVEAFARGLVRQQANMKMPGTGRAFSNSVIATYRCCTGACAGGGAFDACAGGEPGSTTTRVPTCTRL